MDPRRRSSLHFKGEDFDTEGLLKGDGIVNHDGNVYFASDLGDIQVHKIFSSGNLTIGAGTNLFVKESVYSGGEVNAQGSIETEESFVAKYGVFVQKSLKSWEGVKASNITVHKDLISFGPIFSKHEITVYRDLKAHDGVSCGSNINVKGKSFIDGDLRTMGRYKATHVKCSGKITALELCTKGNIFVKLGIEVLKRVKVHGNMKVSAGSIIVPVRLEVDGDLEYVGDLECPLIVVNGDIYLVQP